MKYYKVVWYSNDRYYSVVIITERNRVEYKIGEWAEPQPWNGPLTVFRSYATAKHFCGYASEDIRLFECMIIPSKENKVWDIHDGIGIQHMALNDLPAGTVLADKVKLIKEV